MRKWICVFVAAVLVFGGALSAFAEEKADNGVQKPQTMKYREGEALVKVTAPVQKIRTRLFAGGAFEVETLLDLSAFDTSDSVDGEIGDERQRAGHQQKVTARSNAAVLQNGSISTQASSEDDWRTTEGSEALAEEKILLVKSDSLSTKKLIETMEQYPQVDYAEPNYMFQFAALSNDPYIKRQWYVQKDNGEEKAEPGSAKAATIWESSSTGNTIKGDEPVVAIIDSGVDYEHPDLKNILWDDGAGNYGVDFSDSELLQPDGPMDHYGHGTHVAGIIGAQHNNNEGISGMCKDVKLMALKISDDYGNFDSASAVEAYNYMLEKKQEGINIIAANNSWGGYYYSRIVEEAIDMAGDNGIISIAASGNNSVDHDINLNAPEGGDKTTFLLVNASDEKGEATDFSDYGLIDTDLYAQGMNIFSTVSSKAPEDAEKETPGYGYMDGTSVAAPVVTGAVALLYDYYDVEKLNIVQQKGALEEIRARIAGGVTRTEEMKDLCASGGYLNLEKAVTSPYPVLDALEQNGSEATIKGYFFGKQGTLEMDGKQVEVKSWSDREIVFTLPDETREGLHKVKITDKSKQEYGTTQYGRDELWVEEVRETPSGDFFEALAPPDFDSLGVVHPVEGQSYKMAAYDSKIYLTQYGMHLNGQEHPVVLVYDEKTAAWSCIDVTLMDLEGELQLIADDDNLYLVENRITIDDGEVKSQLQVFRKNDQDDFEAVGNSFKEDLMVYRSMAHDGRYIWMIGGALRNGGGMEPDNRMQRFDTETNQWEKFEFSLKTARYNATAEVVGGKIVITGGINRFGKLERTTEIIDLKTGLMTMGADLPEMENSQEINMASGTYDGKLIISGMFDTKEHTADTYVYDLKTNTWQILNQRLAGAKVFLMDGAVSGEYFYVYGVMLDGGSKKHVFRRLRLIKPPSEEEDIMDETEDEEAGDEERNEDMSSDGEKEDGDGDGGERKKTNDKGKGSRVHERLSTRDASDILPWLTLMTAALTATVVVAFLGTHKQKR